MEVVMVMVFMGSSENNNKEGDNSLESTSWWWWYSSWFLVVDLENPERRTTERRSLWVWNARQKYLLGDLFELNELTRTRFAIYTLLTTG